MGLMELYVIFCVATAITTLILWVWPELKDARMAGVENTATMHPINYCVIYLIIASIFAPFIFPVIIIPGKDKKFAEGIRKSIYEKD
jgi:hypothetical protein